MFSAQFIQKLTTGIISFFILLFTYTAVSKLLEVKHFQTVLAASSLIGKNAAVVAWLVPVVELVITGLLFWKATQKRGLLLTVLAMGLFTGYIGYLLLFADKLPCACGGVIGAMGWKLHLVFNMVCTGLAFWAWRQWPLVQKQNFLFE